jgi:hypothetical protein
MAYTTINKSKLHQNTMLYTGDDGTRNITETGTFQADWVWIKRRNSTSDHYLVDAVRGATKAINSNTNAAEATHANGVTGFVSDGFSLGGQSGYNNTGDTFVAWTWKANGAGSVDSSTGSISATVSANTTAGFSIIKFTNPASGSFTIPHGLGVVPDMLWFKCTAGVQSWFVLHKDLANFTDRYLRLQTDVAQVTYSMQTSAPTSTLLTLNSGGVSNGNAETICYAFAEKTGYSKTGKYVGNNNANGTFVYCGFKPAFVLIKIFDGDADWTINDNKRDLIPQPNNFRLFPNTTAADNTGSDSMDFLSNGFKLRSTDSGNNSSSNTYIYYAFAENTLVGTNNISTTAA